MLVELSARYSNIVEHVVVPVNVNVELARWLPTQSLYNLLGPAIGQQFLLTRRARIIRVITSKIQTTFIRKEGNVLFNNTLNTFYLWLYGRKEGNILFNDALNTFYLWLYGVRHMVKDHSDSERGNLLPPHRLLFLNSSKGSFICTIPQTGLHIPLPLLHQSWSTGWNEK